MTMIPEELKNSKCCLKCKSVDVEYTTNEIKIGTSGATREIYKCKKCSGYITVCNEITTSGMSFVYFAFVLCAALHIAGALEARGFLESIKTNHLFIADIVIILISVLIWVHNYYHKIKITKFLREYVQNKD